MTALALLLALLGSEPAAAASPHLRTSVEAIAPPASVTPGLFDLGEGHLLFVPAKAAGGRPVPLLVLLHGHGGTSASLMRRFHADSARLGIALLGVKSRGDTWDVVAARMAAGSSEFAADVPRIDAALRSALARVRADPSRIGIAGFSDGASYALSVGTANPQLFSSVLAFSPGMAELRAAPRRGGAPAAQRIFVSHGRYDPILSYGYTTGRIVPPLRRRGLVTLRSFDGGHEIPAAVGAEALSMFVDGNAPAGR